MSILVTGAGVIGSLTAKALADAGEHVLLADIRPGDQPGPGITRMVLDVCDFGALEQVVATQGVTAIIHTAAMLSTGIRQDPLAGYRVNTLGAAHVLDVARRRGLRRVVLASSTTVGYPVFGSHGPELIEEDFAMRVHGERPTSIYAATKLANEHLGLLYADLYGVDCLFLRYGAVIGGPLAAPTSVPGRLLSVMAEAARTGQGALDDPFLIWGGREEFVDARDCARANVLALSAGPVPQRVFNIASGEWQSMAEFVASAQAALGPFSMRVPSEPATGFAGFPYRRPARSDISAARTHLGFEPAYGLQASILHWTGQGA